MPDPKETFNVDDLVRNHHVPTVPEPPKAKAKLATGSFIAQDGRTMYRYNLDGEIVVLPKPIEHMTEQDFYNMPVSLYDPYVGRLPQNLTVVFNDPQWAGYWFNKKANDGARVNVARSLGYLPVKRDELKSVGVGINDADGSIEQHDLVLMKIHKAKLFLKYKEWIDKAKIMGGIDSYKKQADNSVIQAGGDLTKAAFYLTDQAKQEYQGLGPVTNLPTVEAP